MSDLMTIKDVCSALRTSRSQLYRYMRRDIDPLVFFKVGKVWLIPATSFKDWFERNAVYSA